MTTIHHDPAASDDELRLELYRGRIAVSSPTDTSVAYCAFAAELIAEAFLPHEPELAQHELDVADYVRILSELKPAFIHHPESKRFLQLILEERGCDLEQTYFDVPRLRSSTSGGYLTTGIAYAWHPHRDTWYSAPMTQLNFWMPVFPVSDANAMAFHPAYFGTEIANSSAEYNYYEWNSKHRGAAAKNIGQETRPLPRATTDVDISDPLVLVPPVGGLIEFSGHHFHSSIPNTTDRTRFSIDFRTVNVGDIVAGRSAPPSDIHCTGSSIRDFMRASDLSPMPDNIVHMFDDGTESQGDLVYNG